MDGLSYRPHYSSLPSRKRFRTKRPILFLLTLTVLFIQAGVGLPVQAFNSSQPVTPSFQANSSYLAIINNAPEPPIYAKSYLLLDTTSAEIVVGENVDRVVPIASTTKMVTALVARKLFDLDEVVTVSSFSSNIIGSGIGLVTNEKITVENLLKGLLIKSGNDAAFALAEHYSQEYKNYQSFVEQMNNYIEEVGLTNSVFGDPAGLDDEVGRSTSWELAQIARLVLLDPVLSSIVKTASTTIYSADKVFRHDLTNSNRLIQSDSPYYLPGSVGIKTGFTHDAGHCLVSAYESDNGLLVGVVLNTVEYTATASSAESRKLYTWANRYTERRQY